MFPARSTATLSGEKKPAAVPVPSALPELPEPATVVTLFPAMGTSFNQSGIVGALTVI